ncbi:MAG TPA: S8 family peptidase [Rhizomicrobium sp.]|nr:S8 family peptidase [Rhizomicrobium sp.]
MLELEPDEDKNPVLYLLISDNTAFRQLIGLWTRFSRGQDLPAGWGAPWRNLLSQLRDLRPWGPRDRLMEGDLDVLRHERADNRGMVRIELELVFRSPEQEVEQRALAELNRVGGKLISRTRIDGAKYHAMLVDVPVAEMGQILSRGDNGLVAAEEVMHIRPQSAVHVTLFESHEVGPEVAAANPNGDPIAAIFDAVPLAGHPRLANRLSIEDPFGLESLAVGSRIHGTAMASAVLHGDLNALTSGQLSRRVHFVNIMFAPAEPGTDEKLPDRLPADIFHVAVVGMKAGADPTAPSVIVVNASVGDRNKPFMGRASGWARVIDYLSHRYGVLFVISAGNHLSDLRTPDINTTAFEALPKDERAKVALRASAADAAARRILSPAESMNAVTVGALNSDLHVVGQVPSLAYDVWQDTGLCTVSSGLGLGIGSSTKPDILAPGGRHYVRLAPDSAGHRLRPMDKGANVLGGILVASPPRPTDVGTNSLGRTVGTSVAAAMTTGLAARAHEALEAAYDDFVSIAGPQRAVLLKVLVVHSSKWTPARDLILEVVGPPDNRKNVRQRDNIRRYLGFGAIDGALILDCATDRATLWAVGTLNREEAHTFSIQLPSVMSGKATFHELSATLAWFAPPRVGSISYRGVRLKLIEPENPLDVFAVQASKEQPDINQSHSGTVVHRRWSGGKAAALGGFSEFELMIQRQPDDIDDPVPYALVTTITMPGVAGVYTEVKSRVAVQPKVPVPA